MMEARGSGSLLQSERHEHLQIACDVASAFLQQWQARAM